MRARFVGKYCLVMLWNDAACIARELAYVRGDQVSALVELDAGRVDARTQYHPDQVRRHRVAVGGDSDAGRRLIRDEAHAVLLRGAFRRRFGHAQVELRGAARNERSERNGEDGAQLHHKSPQPRRRLA